MHFLLGQQKKRKHLIALEFVLRPGEINFGNRSGILECIAPSCLFRTDEQNSAHVNLGLLLGRLEAEYGKEKSLFNTILGGIFFPTIVARLALNHRVPCH